MAHSGAPKGQTTLARSSACPVWRPTEHQKRPELNFCADHRLQTESFGSRGYTTKWKSKLPLNFWLFSVPPTTTKIFENNFPEKLWTSLIKSKTFFHNRKLTSIRVVFRLNKTFIHFDYNYVRIKCLLMTQNRKLLISSSKMRNYIGKKCKQSLYLNPKLSP